MGDVAVLYTGPQPRIQIPIPGTNRVLTVERGGMLLVPEALAASLVDQGTFEAEHRPRAAQDARAAPELLPFQPPEGAHRTPAAEDARDSDGLSQED